MIFYTSAKYRHVSIVIILVVGSFLLYSQHKTKVIPQAQSATPATAKVQVSKAKKGEVDLKCFKHKAPPESTWNDIAKKINDSISKREDKDCRVTTWRKKGKGERKVIFPPFGICLHVRKQDHVVSGSYWNGFQWEPQTTEDLLKLLELDPCSGFINVGANIGAHVLPIARQGYRVLAVEATRFNVGRLRSSINLNGFEDRVSLLHAAISDRAGTVTMKIHPNNAGATFVERDRNKDLGWLGATNMSAVINETTSTLTLNDLVDLVPFRTAVLKVDIETFECYILRSNKVLNSPGLPENSDRFFKEINVRAIIIEFATVHDKQGVHSQCLSNMMEDLYQRGFKLAWNWPYWANPWDPRTWRNHTGVGFGDVALTRDNETAKCCYEQKLGY